MICILISRMIEHTLRIMTVAALLVGSSCTQDPAPTLSALPSDNLQIESFNVRNSEIRQDIINELLSREIEHWVNEDNSISFYSRDAEQVDAIGFAAIGAYAARN